MPHTGMFFFMTRRSRLVKHLQCTIFHGEKSKVCKHFSLVITFDLRESWELLLLELLFWGEFGYFFSR